MTRKIFRNGNSLVVSLPPSVVERLGLREGSEVEVIADDDRGAILVLPIEPPQQELSAEFVERVDRFIARYRVALDSLARR
jgi:putative addiction module antidote